jgi:hypothetical protein
MTGFSLFLNVMAIRLFEGSSSYFLSLTFVVTVTVSRQLHAAKTELKITLKQIEGTKGTGAAPPDEPKKTK